MTWALLSGPLRPSQRVRFLDVDRLPPRPRLAGPAQPRRGERFRPDYVNGFAGICTQIPRYTWACNHARAHGVRLADSPRCVPWSSRPDGAASDPVVSDPTALGGDNPLRPHATAVDHLNRDEDREGDEAGGDTSAASQVLEPTSKATTTTKSPLAPPPAKCHSADRHRAIPGSQARIALPATSRRTTPWHRPPRRRTTPESRTRRSGGSPVARGQRKVRIRGQRKSDT